MNASEFQFNVYTDNLLANIRLNANYQFHQKAIQEKLSKKLKIIDLFHPLSITKAHQLHGAQFTQIKFLSQDYLVSASDDGFVKLWFICGPFIKLKAIFVSNVLARNLEALEVNQEKMLIAAQYDNTLVLWDAKQYFADNKKIVIESIYEHDFLGLKYYKNQQLVQKEEVVEQLIFVGNMLIWQSKTQVYVVNLNQLQEKPKSLFKFLHPISKQSFQIGWSVYAEQQDMYFFSFSLDNFQYIALVKLQCYSEEQINTPYSIYYRTENSRTHRIFEGQLFGGLVRFVEVTFPPNCFTSKSEKMIPNYISIQGNYLCFSYQNCSHFFCFLIDKVEQIFQDLHVRRLQQQTPVRHNFQKTKKQIQEDYSFICVSVEPFAFSVHCIQLPATLSEDCVFAVENIKISLQNMVCAHVSYKNQFVQKNMLLFYDLNEIVPSKQYYYPINKLILAGVNGGGIQTSVINFKQQLCFHHLNQKEYSNEKSVWVVVDAFNVNLTEQHYFETQDDENQQINVNTQDNIIYFISEGGHAILNAVKFPSDNKKDVFEFFTDICIQKNQLAITNTLGNIMLMGDNYYSSYKDIQKIINQNNIKTSQFYIFETPGLSKYKYKQQNANDYDESYFNNNLNNNIKDITQHIKVYIKQQCLINDQNFAHFLKQLIQNDIQFTIITEQHTEISSSSLKKSNQLKFQNVFMIDIDLSNNALLIIILIMYFNANDVKISYQYTSIFTNLAFQYLSSNYVGKKQNNYYMVNKFSQLSCFVEILFQLLMCLPLDTSVSEKQVINQDISFEQYKILQQLIGGNKQNHNVIPHHVLIEYGFVYLEKLNYNIFNQQTQLTVQNNIQQNIQQVCGYCASVQETHHQIKNYKFLNKNILRNTTKYNDHIQADARQYNALSKIEVFDVIQYIDNVPQKIDQKILSILNNNVAENVITNEINNLKRIEVAVEISGDDYYQCDSNMLESSQSQNTASESGDSCEEEEEAESQYSYNDVENVQCTITSSTIVEYNQYYMAAFRAQTCSQFNLLNQAPFVLQAGNVIFFNGCMYRTSMTILEKILKQKFQKFRFDALSNFYLIQKIQCIKHNKLIVQQVHLQLITEELLNKYDQLVNADLKLFKQLNLQKLIKQNIETELLQVDLVPLIRSYQQLHYSTGLIPLQQIVRIFDCVGKIEENEAEAFTIQRQVIPQIVFNNISVQKRFNNLIQLSLQIINRKNDILEDLIQNNRLQQIKPQLHEYRNQSIDIDLQTPVFSLYSERFSPLFKINYSKESKIEQVIEFNQYCLSDFSEQKQLSEKIIQQIQTDIQQVNNQKFIAKGANEIIMQVKQLLQQIKYTGSYRLTLSQFEKITSLNFKKDEDVVCYFCDIEIAQNESRLDFEDGSFTTKIQRQNFTVSINKVNVQKLTNIYQIIQLYNITINTLMMEEFQDLFSLYFAREEDSKNEYPISINFIIKRLCCGFYQNLFQFINDFYNLYTNQEKYVENLNKGDLKTKEAQYVQLIDKLMLKIIDEFQQQNNICSQQLTDLC